jgi:hypothetical protein
VEGALSHRGAASLSCSAYRRLAARARDYVSRRQLLANTAIAASRVGSYARCVAHLHGLYAVSTSKEMKGVPVTLLTGAEAVSLARFLPSRLHFRGPTI